MSDFEDNPEPNNSANKFGTFQDSSDDDALNLNEDLKPTGSNQDNDFKEVQEPG